LPENFEEHVTLVEAQTNSIKVQLIDVAHANKFLNYLLSNGTFITGFNEILPTLNEIFIKIVGGVSDE
jgi:ABC-2 type transport system ATP-binding protein